MEGFGDIFADVHFEDVHIDPNATLANLAGGNPGTPPAGDTGKTVEGQTPASPTGTEKQGAAKVPDGDKGAEPVKKEEEGKVPPYDQDPKWKKARAAEAALDALKEELGILDTEELKALAKQGMDLSKILKGKDVSKVLEDADYARRVREKWDEDEQTKSREGEEPDARIARLEGELANTKKALEDYRAGVQDKEHAEEVISNFNREVSKVVDTIGEDVAFSDPERQLLHLVLGVENPANMIDVEDHVAVRKMALQGAKNFQGLVKQIREDAVTQYIAGKKGMAVDTNRGADAVKKPGQEQTREMSQQINTKKDVLTPQDIDSTFDLANREFTEILIQGLKGLT